MGLSKWRSAHETVASEFSTSSSELTAACAEAADFRKRYTHWEALASLRDGKHREAEAKCEAMSSELQATEARFANRGAHIDALLRDKERLWAQLARTRGEVSDTATMPNKQQAPTVELRGIRQRPASAQRSSSVPPGAAARPKLKAKPGPQLINTEVSNQQPKTKTRNPPHDGNDQRRLSSDTCRLATATLERQLWHAQRALEK